MNQGNIALKQGTNYPINRYDLWEFVIRHWDAILESDIAEYGGFDRLCGSSVFVAWMQGSKNTTGIITNDFLPYTEVETTANRLSVRMFEVVVETVAKDVFLKLFYTKQHLTPLTLKNALLYERRRCWG